MMSPKTADRERAWLEDGSQRLLELSRLARLHLILDCYVRPPRRAVLRGKHPLEGEREIVPYLLELRAFDPVGTSGTEVDDTGEHCAGPGGGGRGAEPRGKLPLQAWREMVKQGEVRGHLIALRRIMRAPEVVEPGKVRVQ